MKKVLHPWCMDSRCLVKRLEGAMWVEVGGPVENIVHQFCECPKVSEVWGWLRGQIVMELLENGQGQCSDFDQGSVDKLK